MELGWPLGTCLSSQSGGNDGTIHRLHHLGHGDPGGGGEGSASFCVYSIQWVLDQFQAQKTAAVWGPVYEGRY